MLSFDTSVSPIISASAAKATAKPFDPLSVSPTPAPLRVSIKNVLRSVSTKKSQASASSHVIDSTAQVVRCEGSTKKDDEARHEHLRENLGMGANWELDSKPEVTLFVAGKMYMGREMKYLGRN
jgi:hypothetical protein